MSALAKPVRAIALMAVLVTGVALTGCTGDSDPKASTTSASAPSSGSSSTPSPSVVLNKDYDLDGLTRPVPQIIETKTDKGQSFGLTSIVRVGEDRVVVSGVLTPATPIKVGTDAEPGFLELAKGGDFSAVTVAKPGDATTTYLPVRDPEGRCLCSSVRPGFDGKPIPVSVVVSAPKDLTEVDLTVSPVGTFTGVKISAPAPTPQLATALGVSQGLIVDSAAREGGTVTARVRLQSFGDTERFVRGVFNPPVIGEQGTCYRSLFVLGGGSKAGIVTKKGCVAGQVPEKDKQVALELSMGDPGGEPLTFIPSDGLPIFGVPSTGTGTEGSADLVDFAFRSKTAAATVSSGEQVSIDLATSVLFALDSAELTPAADASLNAAVQALQDQSCRRLTIGGHTDSQGEAAYNLTLSQQRAEAVKQALGAKLGAGWTLDAQGFGETELAVKEEGSPEAIAAAQERNRRVEVTACSPA